MIVYSGVLSRLSQRIVCCKRVPGATGAVGGMQSVRRGPPTRNEVDLRESGIEINTLPNLRLLTPQTRPRVWCCRRGHVGTSASSTGGGSARAARAAPARPAGTAHGTRHGHDPALMCGLCRLALGLALDASPYWLPLGCHATATRMTAQRAARSARDFRVGLVGRERESERAGVVVVESAALFGQMRLCCAPHANGRVRRSRTTRASGQDAAQQRPHRAITPDGANRGGDRLID